MGKKWAAVIGSPIDHSLSPVLHRTAYEIGGLDWEYRRCQVNTETTPNFMASLDERCVGLSVTMPCKQVIANYVDTTESLAKAVGSINTVVISSGLRAGFNTDVHGIVQAVLKVNSEDNLQLEDLRSINKRLAKSVVILGSRATASSALAAVISLGFERVSIVGRGFQGQDNVLQAATRLGVNFDPLLWKHKKPLKAACQSADLIISTVPANATSELADNLRIRKEQQLLDVTYGEGSTPLMEAFQKSKSTIIPALSMLTFQGLAQVKLMTGLEIPFEPVYQAVLAAKHGNHSH